MNEDTAPLGVDMINIRASDTHLLKAGECTVFISLKCYSRTNGIVNLHWLTNEFEKQTIHTHPCLANKTR